MKNEKAGHTPEPWIWLQDGEKDGCDKYGTRLIRDYRDSGSPALILAPLHEAAPDLLAALEEALDQLESWNPEGPEDTFTMKRARAAIAKAAGKQIKHKGKYIMKNTKSIF